jgi:hypothetical protein
MPIRKSTPSADLNRCTYLVWGSPKCGKTTFASRFPGAVFIATEDGMKGVEAARWETEDGRYVVQSWQEILDATKELLTSTPRPSMIIIDTLDNAILLLERHYCDKYGVDFKNDGDLGFGKGSSLINGELRRYLMKLSSMGVGIILISHTAAVERHGKKGQVTVDQPSIPDKVMPMILGMVDFTLYCTTDTFKKSADSEPITRHVLYTRPAPTHVAGHRIGNLPEVLPLSYFEFAKAFAAGVAAKAAGAPATTTSAAAPSPTTAPTAPATAPTGAATAPPAATAPAAGKRAARGKVEPQATAGATGGNGNGSAGSAPGTSDKPAPAAETPPEAPDPTSPPTT